MFAVVDITKEAIHRWIQAPKLVPKLCLNCFLVKAIRKVEMAAIFIVSTKANNPKVNVATPSVVHWFECGVKETIYKEGA